MKTEFGKKTPGSIDPTKAAKPGMTIPGQTPPFNPMEAGGTAKPGQSPTFNPEQTPPYNPMEGMEMGGTGENQTPGFNPGTPQTDSLKTAIRPGYADDGTTPNMAPKKKVPAWTRA